MADKKYVVWNPYKVNGSDECTYEELLNLEASEGYSYSSVIYTSNIEDFINAVHNEADCALGYKRIDPKYFY